MGLGGEVGVGEDVGVVMEEGEGGVGEGEMERGVVGDECGGG